MNNKVENYKIKIKNLESQICVFKNKIRQIELKNDPSRLIIIKNSKTQKNKLLIHPYLDKLTINIYIDKEWFYFGEYDLKYLVKYFEKGDYTQNFWLMEVNQYNRKDKIVIGLDNITNKITMQCSIDEKYFILNKKQIEKICNHYNEYNFYENRKKVILRNS